MSFIIRNDWDCRTWCGDDNSWVNDGRESAHYPTPEAAQLAMYSMPLEDQERCTIEEYEVQ